MKPSVPSGTPPRYEPFGWHHWPDHSPVLPVPPRPGRNPGGRRRGQRMFQAASRMIPGDLESWHAEWMRVADRNDAARRRGERAGHVRTAMNCWLRAADYYRQAEFWLAPTTPAAWRPSPLRGGQPQVPALSRPAGRGGGDPLRGRQDAAGLFHPSPVAAASKQPVLISVGGLDRSRTNCGSCRPRAPAARHFGAAGRRPGAGRRAAPPQDRHRATTTRCRSASASTGWRSAPTSIRRASR